MHKLSLASIVLASVLAPLVASAHQVALFDIKGTHYQFVIGSLNEPVVVDDKTGLDLTVTKCRTATCMPAMSADGDMDGPAGTPVTGLESTLKVELGAGDTKKTLDIAPQYGKPGAYTAPFFFTVPTTISYRIFGTIADTPIDFTVVCLPAGTPRAADDMTKVQVSEGVQRTALKGGFGCPLEKSGLGFPEASSDLRSLALAQGDSERVMFGSLILAVIAIAVAVQPFFRARQ